MLLPITSMTAVCLVPLFLFLTFRVIVYRRTHRVSIGDQGDQVLLRRMRMHANFIEYTPYALLLLLLCEIQDVTNWALWVSASLLLIGRYIHAFGLSSPKTKGLYRVGGMVLTISSIVTSSLMLLLASFGY
ncbi:MAG: MAPEG family protein [Bdellovibrionales bacterium]|nr:MAPEG family protein [Bdellovibrionales bacterium]